MNRKALEKALGSRIDIPGLAKDIEGLLSKEKVKIVKIKELAEVCLINNKDNTITDTATGLMWIQDHTIIKGFDVQLNKVETDAAIKELNKIKYAGYNDWFVPTRSQLLSIVDITKYNPAINPIFKNTKSSWYWTNEEVADFPGGAWYVGFYSGSVNWVNKGSQNYVRPVRLSQ